MRMIVILSAIAVVGIGVAIGIWANVAYSTAASSSVARPVEVRKMI